MSAWGLLPFGTDAPWGGPGLLSIIKVLCTGGNTIRVFFTTAPKALDWGGWQDATNPIYWTLTAIDPVEIGINGEEIVEPGVRRPSFEVFIADLLPDEDDPTQLVIRTAPQLEPGISYQLELVGAIRGENCEEFAGLSTFEIRARNKPIPRKNPQIAAEDTFRDWANPYYVTDPTTGQLVEGPGTVLVEQAGDIVLEDNAASLKKRVHRVILTEAGAFAHLPNFGQRATVKSIARQDEVQRIASRLQEQIQRFEDVQSASVEAVIEVAPSGAGILRFRVTVKPRSDGLITMAFQQPLK